jgi:hypothetical protein
MRRIGWTVDPGLADQHTRASAVMAGKAATIHLGAKGVPSRFAVNIALQRDIVPFQAIWTLERPTDKVTSKKNRASACEAPA